MKDTLQHITQKFKPDVAPRGPTDIHQINRTIMAQTLGELDLKTGAEVGVAEGLHAEVLFNNIPGLKLYGIDAWQHYPGYDEYPDIDDVYHQAQERLKDKNCELIRKFSVEAAKDFDDGSLDFVYIDAAHDFQNVANDVCEWSKKVRIGGVVFGHDYKRTARKGGFRVDVMDVIPGYMYAKAISPWFVLTNDVYDRTFAWDNPGWMFVRLEGQLV